MLAHAKLSKTFWVEALMTLTYVINISPSAPLDGDVPQRVWTSKDVLYRHLEVFGCLAYVHVVKDKWGKLDLKTRLCIFLGYGDDEFGYRLWNLAEKEVIQSRDIVFMEEKTIADWESEKKLSTSESTDEDRLGGSRIHPVGSRMSFDDLSGPTGFGQETESTEGG